jgi:hypothetical protein
MPPQVTEGKEKGLGASYTNILINLANINK